MNISFVELLKINTVLYIIYTNWFSTGIFNSPIILYGLSFLSIMWLILDIQHNRCLKKINDKIISMYIVYGIYAFVAGIFIAINKKYFSTQMFTYFANLLLYYEIYYISKKEKDTSWIEKGFEISAILALIQIYIFPYADPLSGRLSLGPSSNANMVGVLFTVGIFFLVNNINKVEKKFYARLILIILFLYGIVLTGSRKALLAGLVLTIIWVVTYFASEVGKKMKVKSMFSIMLVLIGCIVVVKYISTEFINTDIYYRFNLLISGKGSHMRQDLYRDAFELWKNHILFGVGYCQFIFYTATKHISHSTYMEILSCTGSIGFIIFFIPIINLGLRIIKKMILEKKEKTYNLLMLLAFFLIEIALGFGQEWIYYSIHMIMILYLSLSLGVKNTSVN